MLPIICWAQTGVGAMLSRVATLREEERGQALVEYGLILALIAAVVVGTLAIMGTHVLGLFETLVETIKEA